MYVYIILNYNLLFIFSWIMYTFTSAG